MNVNISVLSAETLAACAKTAQLVALNPQMCSADHSLRREHHRFVASWEPKDLEREISSIWHADFFGTTDLTGHTVPGDPEQMIEALNKPPEIIRVQFHDVRCPEVCGQSWGALDRVIMVSPDDPFCSKLLRFRLIVDTRKSARTITVFVHMSIIKPENLEPFLRLLRICAKRFYQDQPVMFESRKHIGHARRQYQLWLEFCRQEYPDAAIGQSQPDVRNADRAWQHLVATERTLQGFEG